MYWARAEVIKEYERCVEDWIKKNKQEHNTSVETLITNPCKEINEK